MKVSFFISSEQLNLSASAPARIAPGDHMYAVSRKFSDQAMKQFIGNTYANYTVLDSQMVQNGVWKVRTSSTRYLQFVNQGYVIVMGVSDQLWTLDADGKRLMNLQVLEDHMSVVSGSGKFVNTIGGSYNVQTVGTKIHRAVLDLTDSGNALNTVLVCILIILILIMFFLVFFFRRNQ